MARALRRIGTLSLLLLFLGVSTASADRFARLPTPEGNSAHLKIRVVRYDGNTNGKMIIDIKNTSKRTRRFSAEGVFFVPKGDPEKAPQRLGASGSFAEIAKGKRIRHASKVAVRAGETKRLHLEVFCIDSHRSSPNSSTKFTVAKKLLPKKLRRAITIGAKRAYKKARGNFAAAKSEVQSHMWKTRDKKWVKVEGERAAEKSTKPSPRQMRHPRHRRIKQPMRPIQQQRK